MLYDILPCPNAQELSPPANERCELLSEPAVRSSDAEKDNKHRSKDEERIGMNRYLFLVAENEGRCQRKETLSAFGLKFALFVPHPSPAALAVFQDNNNILYSIHLLRPRPHGPALLSVLNYFPRHVPTSRERQPEKRDQSSPCHCLTPRRHSAFSSPASALRVDHSTPLASSFATTRLSLKQQPRLTAALLFPSLGAARMPLESLGRIPFHSVVVDQDEKPTLATAVEFTATAARKYISIALSLILLQSLALIIAQAKTVPRIPIATVGGTFVQPHRVFLILRHTSPTRRAICQAHNRESAANVDSTMTRLGCVGPVLAYRHD
jgi:hypothetical protein